MATPEPVGDTIPPPENGETADLDDVGVNIIRHGLTKLKYLFDYLFLFQLVVANNPSTARIKPMGYRKQILAYQYKIRHYTVRTTK